MKKILVTTDLSAKSKAGIRFAIQLQKQTGCSLLFYHAIEIMKPTSWNDRKFKSFADEKKAEFVARLIAFVQEVYEDAGAVHGNNSYHAEIGTRVAEMTIGYAQKARAEAVCIATRGGGRIEKLLGSVTSSILVGAPLPVIIVPPRYRIAKVEEVYYATDLESFPREFRIVQAFTGALGSRLAVVHYDYMYMSRATVQLLQTKYSKYESPGVRLIFRRRRSDATLAECIRQDLKKEKPGILVLFTKLSKGWFRRLFSASRTEQLALHPTVPLLVFRKKSAK